MDLEELRAVQTRERATDGLQDLRDSFYTDVATYIQDLREERDRVASEAEDPFRDDEVQSLTDEIEVAEQVAEAIYERRIGKLVKQASLAAAGMPDDQEGLTTEEQALYDDLVDRIRENKRGVLDVIAGDAPARDPEDVDPVDDAFGGPEDGEPTPSGGSTSTDVPSSGVESKGSPDASAAEAMGGTETEETDAIDEESADDRDDHVADDVDRTTVRITSDVGEIYGVDEREYSLEEDDVVRLPEANAGPLLDRDAAERLE
ncbi:MAG: hypothetical protein ABEJ77_03880 [Halanaeroarchaeum sp.]